MKAMMIGGALASASGGLYATGVFDGPDIVQTVQATPSETYDGFSILLNDEDDVVYFAIGAEDLIQQRDELGIDVDVASVPDQSIDYSMTKDGNPFLNINVKFEPIENGNATRVSADIDLDSLDGADGQAIPLRSQFIFKQALKLMMGQVIRQIENGQMAQVQEALDELREMLESDPAGWDTYAALIEARGEPAYGEDAQGESAEGESAAGEDPLGGE